MRSDRPLLTVVTPFKDTAPYLAECIESVLSQGYGNLEYILSDNCSTDGSTEIAERYAKLDPRIKFVRQPRLFPQAEHYNNVLKLISPDSRYCKIVQADDYLLPGCLEKMVACFEQSDSIGLVSSYYIKGNVLMGSGYPYPKPMWSGREMARLFLRTGIFVFGSESTVMYRSEHIRAAEKFYGEPLLHADTEKCLEILAASDFGFVHEVLSFLRMENVNESISARTRMFQPNMLDRYIVVQRFADAFFEPQEAEPLKREVRGAYYRMLGEQALRFRPAEFWKYHARGLATLNESIDWSSVALHSLLAALWIVSNPGTALARLFRLRRKTSAISQSKSVPSTPPQARQLN